MKAVIVIVPESNVDVTAYNYLLLKHSNAFVYQ